MILWVILTLILFAVYTATSLVFIGTQKGDVKETINTKSVSVIIATRNEAANLPACLTSLSKLDYPRDLLEIIIVDDNSRDESKKIIGPFVQKHKNFKYFFLGNGKKQRPGKAGALMHGINNSSGQIIFITDADCRVPSTWIKSMLALFDGDTGLVGGYTLIEAHSILGKIEAFDLFFMLSIASSASILNRPCSWIGNNMAFRRQVYTETGGYSKHGFSLIEDQALVDAVAKGTKWRVRLLPYQKAAVKSLPAPNIFQLFNQRKRWLHGFGSIRPLGRFLVLVSGLTKMCLPLIFLIYPPVPAIALLATILVCDFMIVFLPWLKLKNKLDWRCFFGFEFIQILFAYILPILYLSSKTVSWKDYKYQMNNLNPEPLQKE